MKTVKKMISSSLILPESPQQEEEEPFERLESLTEENRRMHLPSLGTEGDYDNEDVDPKEVIKKNFLRSKIATETTGSGLRRSSVASHLSPGTQRLDQRYKSQSPACVQSDPQDSPKEGE